MHKSDSTVNNPEKNQVKVNDWQLFLQLLPYITKYKITLIFSILLLFPVGIAEALQPIIIGKVISLISQESATYSISKSLFLPDEISVLKYLLLLTVIIIYVFSSFQGYLIQKAGQKILSDIRNDLFKHVISLPISYFKQTSSGELITIIISDIQLLKDLFSAGILGIISDLLLTLIIILVMFTLQWQLTLIILLSLFTVGIFVFIFQRKLRKFNYQSREKLSILNSILQENLNGIDIIQLFQRESFNSNIFRASNQSYINDVKKTIFYDSTILVTLKWTSTISIVGVILIGGSFILENSITIGVLSTFILYTQRLFDPIKQFAEKFATIQGGFTAIERITRLLNEPVEIPASNSINSILNQKNKTINSNHKIKNLCLKGRGKIIFENVWFAYRDNNYVIKNLNFTIHPQEKVALVGPTGAGKSSILRLLCRLYEPSKGRIIVNGIDIREVPKLELRRHIEVILQDSFIFAGDVKSNITLGDTFSMSEIRMAAEKTNIASFIEKLPQGYDTQLREEGSNLSNGQKQLLTFARAIIRNPQVLVLDEATSDLDIQTENLIQNALDRLLTNRSVLIIAHRLSTIVDVDKILVLEQGQLVESGNHQTLLQQGGLYANLYNAEALHNRQRIINKGV